MSVGFPHSTDKLESVADFWVVAGEDGGHPVTEFRVRRVRPPYRMNLTTIHSKPMIFRAGATATRVDVAPDHLVLDCPMPWLAGPESQVLARGAVVIRSDGDWLLQGSGMLAGVLTSTGRASLEEETCRLYRRMFAVTGRLNRYRIWNYVPGINELVAGVENYVAFNSGRYRAFTEKFGGISMRDLTAASAVGTRGGALTLAFVAGTDPVRSYENPLQTPAVNYPMCYGPDSPLFSRGGMVRVADGSTCWHLSGTASIRSSETVGGDFARQLDVTLENIEQMLGEMAVPAARQSAWKVFLRDRRDLEVCRQRLAAVYPDEVDRMMFLEADICRRDLLLEIEGVFRTPG